MVYIPPYKSYSKFECQLALHGTADRLALKSIYLARVFEDTFKSSDPEMKTTI